MHQPIQFHKLKVADVRRETPEAVSIAFEIPGNLADLYRFQPGQHLTLRTTINGEEVRRSYSICTGLDDGEMRVAVKKVEGGTFSVFCNEAIRAGDTIDVMTPQGRFGVMPDSAVARIYLAIVAGSGITPVASIMRTVLKREPKSRFVLIYGNRNANSIIFRDDLEDLKDRFLSRLSVHHILSREEQDVGILNGRIDPGKIEAILRAVAPAREIDHVFLCGPGAMIEESRAALTRLGVSPDRIHTEYFSTDGLPVTRAQAASGPKEAGAAAVAVAHVTLNGTAFDLQVREGETIVDAGLREGHEMPYSCRGGMCCTCRARLVSGEAKMDLNYSLEPWELQAGFLLTCQSRPLTREVTIDYDAV
ncbi:MAG: phenylacetate-CoA oxygenase/reductase subunit PaaK [Pseudorhodoplanes sp.]|nr:phenylacetate-CoA oxygenase/reductase subunit PaaK [Pseudorhodoplanes sp.]